MKEIVSAVMDAIHSAGMVEVEVSARHVHLSQEHVEFLFGPGATLTNKRPLSQPGQFLAEQRVTLIGPKGTATLKCGIVAARHVHISTKSLGEMRLRDMQTVDITSSGPRSVTFHNVIVRENTVTDLDVIHMDFEEGNAAGVKTGDYLELEY